MRVLGKKLLVKLKNKNLGNKLLCKAIDQLISDLENWDFKTSTIEELRSDADRVHGDGFYFFNIQVHRTLVLIDLDEDGEATIIWAGSHDEYERTFKNNKATIRTWLRNKEYID